LFIAYQNSIILLHFTLYPQINISIIYNNTCASFFRLFLQWNSLGQSKEAFGVLCEGIGSNQSLQELDLRNNSLRESSAEEIAFAIRANKSLKTIGMFAL